MKKRLVILSGAGISAESGLKTFRDSNGLWENHRVEDVATPEAFARNPELVLEFYNQRRKAASEAKPNAAHNALAALEGYFDVQIITQNVDNLHERAGSLKVLHLHGQLNQARSVKDANLIIEIGHKDIKMGEFATDRGQLRPNIVWFGEAVPMMETAINYTSEADFFIVIGTSLQVYPAASLIHYVPTDAQKFIIDKVLPDVSLQKMGIEFIQGTASSMMPLLKKNLIELIQ
jgi:NAD-dependent deacetylase